jgi:pteridine reductase
MNRITKPVALITGAAKRVGHSIAQRFAREGYALIIHYGRSGKEAEQAVADLKRAGHDAIACGADLTDAAAMERMMEAVYREFGRLDVLINCAAVFFPDQLSDFRVANLDQAWQVNCRAPLLLTQSFHSHARSLKQEGVVINIVDQKVRGNFHPDDFSYTVSKAALGQLTSMLAVSASPVLRVNAVYPGLMAPSGDQTEADFAHARLHATPLGYIATPQDIAEACILLTLCSFNGCDFVIDAGQNLVRVDHDVIHLYRAPPPSRRA